MGWAGIKNGDLLVLAEKQFEVFVTVDRNLSFQQNLIGYNIAVLVLRARTNRLRDLPRSCRNCSRHYHPQKSVKFF
jgi:hypothetical protein